MVETNETMSFDDNGVCNICNSFSERDNWDKSKKKKILLKLLKNIEANFNTMQLFLSAEEKIAHGSPTNL